jgi:hypothetical protein
MKRILAGLGLALALPLLALAQAQPAAKAQGQKLILEYVDGEDFKVLAPDKSTLKFNAGIVEGDEIPVGSTISTGASTIAELRIKPNGTIVKLAKNTTFSVTAVASESGAKNTFALVAGKVRAVAAKGGRYEITTKTTVCGVRGTDFSLSVEEGAKALLMVQEGLVEFQKLDEAGAVVGDINVGAGEAADAFAAAFESFKYSAEQFAQEYGDLDFQKLKTEEVGGHEGEAAQAPGTETPGTVVATPVDAATAAETLAEGAGKMDAKDVESGFAKWIREALGMEIGSVTINEQTYAKAVIQPNIKLGKAKLGLYLPIIYSSNLFDSSDWYHPAGNDEWSFGFDKGWNSEHWTEALGDAATDFALKIKYFEYGTQLEDPFFVKVGNLEDLTLGHGLIMRNYANDTEFPSVRRVGFNLGFDGKSAGFEAIVNDLADPEIFGARLFARPIEGFPLAFGVSGVADIDPAADLSAAQRSAAGDPIFIGTGLDMDLPIVQSDLLSLRLFADGAVTMPYLREAVGGKDGLRWDLVYNEGSQELKNWGAAGGLIGRVLFIDWRLEYRYYTGIFKPSFFDSTYDRKRSEYVLEYEGYLSNPTLYANLPTVMGVYGEGGCSILNDKLSFNVGYMWPWAPGLDFEQQIEKTSDELHARLSIKKGLIPIIDVAGAVYYDRRGLVKAIYDQSFSLIDENSVLGGEIIVPVPKTPNLDLALLFATVPERDDSGAIVWKNETAGIPYVKPSISIETRLHF